MTDHGLQPISFTEIKTYCELNEVSDIDFFIRAIREMEAIHFKFVSEKIKEKIRQNAGNSRTHSRHR